MGSDLTAPWGWEQSNNGDQQAWGYRNNILIWRDTSSGLLMAFESGGNDTLDFDHNAWFNADSSVWWSNSGGSFASIALAYAGLSATVPVFSDSTKRHGGDVSSETDPFITDIVMGANYLTKITTIYTPSLSDGSGPRSAGIAIPTITDDFSGAAPDIGAIITGRTNPTWGDRTTTAAAATSSGKMTTGSGSITSGTGKVTP